MERMRVAALLVVLASPVYAQGLPPMNLWGDKPARSEQQLERDKAVDRAYRDSLGQIPTRKSSDPWGSVRGAEQKSAKPETGKSTKN